MSTKKDRERRRAQRRDEAAELLAERAACDEPVARWWDQLRQRGFVEGAARVARRKCDDCTFCCMMKEIHDLEKPEREQCPHALGGGCSIYPTKPASCTNYYCGWRLGVGAEHARPDRVGVLLELEPDHRNSAIRAVFRAVGPFPIELGAELTNDAFKAGARCFGCVDTKTEPGANIVLAQDPVTFSRMLGYFARTGESPWNYDPLAAAEITGGDVGPALSPRRFPQ